MDAKKAARLERFGKEAIEAAQTEKSHERKRDKKKHSK